MKTMRIFLWIAVVGWGIGLGAKLFDLLVIANAWSASPPASFALLPYGPRYPINPGDFFQPLSIVMVIGIVGALISGWNSPVRSWLCVALVMFLIIWSITPTIFWPMIRQLYGIATGGITGTDVESVSLAHRWLIWDSFRVCLIAVGFIASVRALSFPVNGGKV